MTDNIERRIQALEKVAHKPFDFTALIARIEALEAATLGPKPSQPIHSQAMLAWEKIKDNLRLHYVYSDALTAEHKRAIDEEQIQVIRMHMGEKS